MVSIITLNVLMLQLMLMLNPCGATTTNRLESALAQFLMMRTSLASSLIRLSHLSNHPCTVPIRNPKISNDPTTGD